MRSLINNTIKNSGLVALIAAVVMVVGGGSAVAGHLITGKQVKNSSLTGSDIRTGSVTGSDIKNKSVNAGDLTDAARDSLKGNQGPAGLATIVSYKNDNQQQTNGTEWHEVVPDQQINVPAGSSKVLVDFNAECAVADNGAVNRYVYVDVKLDGQFVGGQSRMCNNAADLDDARFTANTIQRVLDVTPGAHTISVHFGVSSANATGYLDKKLFTATVGN